MWKLERSGPSRERCGWAERASPHLRAVTHRFLNSTGSRPTIPLSRLSTAGPVRASAGARCSVVSGHTSIIIHHTLRPLTSMQLVYICEDVCNQSCQSRLWACTRQTCGPMIYETPCDCAVGVACALGPSLRGTLEPRPMSLLPLTQLPKSGLYRKACEELLPSATMEWSTCPSVSRPPPHRRYRNAHAATPLPVCPLPEMTMAHRCR